VNHGNGDQGAKPLQQNGGPFDRAEARFTDHDALASGVQRRVKL
jgi:hypothetical protein